MPDDLRRLIGAPEELENPAPADLPEALAQIRRQARQIRELESRLAAARGGPAPAITEKFGDAHRSDDTLRILVRALVRLCLSDNKTLGTAESVAFLRERIGNVLGWYETRP